MQLTAAAAILLCCVVLSSGMKDAAAASSDDDSAVTFGSVIKLRHKSTGAYLHSHKVAWGSGSKQQSVTAMAADDDRNSYWVVKEGNDEAGKSLGTPVECGSRIRLEHVTTNRNLHSHLFTAALSGQQEVSCFGNTGQGDRGDDWVVMCSGTTWRRGMLVHLKHGDTSALLATDRSSRFTNANCPNCPILGQYEVSAARAGRSAEAQWSVPQDSYGIHFVAADS